MNYNENLKILIKKFNCENIILSNNGSIVEVDIIKKGIRYAYLIKSKGIDSTSYDDELNNLVIQYHEQLIDLAKYEEN